MIDKNKLNTEIKIKFGNRLLKGTIIGIEENFLTCHTVHVEFYDGEFGVDLKLSFVKMRDDDKYRCNLNPSQIYLIED